MTRVCRLTELEIEYGVAALVGDAQVALFRLDDEEVCAIDNRDPSTGVSVLSRGIVGSAGDNTVYVASPLHKTRFDLRTGSCLDDPALSVRVWDVAVRGGWVEVGR